jgi:hypothetical protein
MALYFQNLGFAEVCSCPRCGILTHPEYLNYIANTGLVIGCSSCLPPKASMSPAILAQVVREAQVNPPAKGWM